MIEIKRILVPTDLSEYAHHALTYAAELASAYDAALYLLHVVDLQWNNAVGSADFPGPVGDMLPRITETAEKDLDEIKEKIEGIEVNASIVTGSPHVEIVRFAREWKVDVIVLATHGRTGLSHALIGSVAEKVVQMAPCPVLSIKHPEHEFVMP